MRLFIFIFSVLCFCKCSGATPKTQIDVLIVTDERKFNREAFFALFDSFQNIHSTEISHPEILDFIGTDSIRRFDAVVFYDMPEEVILTDIQKQNFLKFFEEGAPAVFLHHSLLSYRHWDQFPEIIGGRYYNKSPLITEQGDTMQSVYQHDVRYRVNIVDAKHPITLGMEDFEILDEEGCCTMPFIGQQRRRSRSSLTKWINRVSASFLIHSWNLEWALLEYSIDNNLSTMN